MLNGSIIFFLIHRVTNMEVPVRFLTGQYWKATNMNLPVFLSGGISLDNLSNIKKLKNFKPEVIDVNSRFESAPGLKDIVQS